MNVHTYHIVNMFAQFMEKPDNIPLSCNRGSCSNGTSQLYVQWQVVDHLTDPSAGCANGRRQVRGGFLHEALLSVAEELAYVSGVCTTLLGASFQHFNGVGPSAINRGSKGIPREQFQGSNKVSNRCPASTSIHASFSNAFHSPSRNQDGLMELPLVGMEAVLSSDDVEVASEDALYDLVLKWARRHHPKLEERQEVFGARLGRLIRFPCMSSRKLRKVLTHNDLDQEFTNKAVLEALFFKVEPAHRRQALAMDDVTNNRRFVERAYKYRPVKVVEFELPYTQCIVYLDLKREECAHLFPSGRVYSQAFYIGGQGFFLSAHCNRDVHNSCDCFGLFLGMQEKGSVSFTIDYEFSARTMPTGQFDSKYKGKYTFAGGKAVGYRNLFAIPWTSFMADDSLYFINDVLHLRAELTIE